MRAPTPPKLGLLGKFALLSALPVIALGLALGLYLRAQIRERAVDNARDAARLIAQLGIQPMLSPLDLRRGLSPSQLVAIDASLRNALSDGEVEGVKIWNHDGWVVYSNDRAQIGKTFPPSDELREALAGEVGHEVSAGDESADEEDHSGPVHGPALEVYVPLQFGFGDEPQGAFEIYLPYAPIASHIKQDMTTMVVLLLAGLGLLYATIFKIVQGASRTLRKQAEENEHQALHDPLTGLPNRSLFHDRIEQAILAALRDGDSVGILIMDVDRFKEVNDTLGHHSGDGLLDELGERLRSVLRESDTVARLGGDEFGIVLPKVGGPAEVAEVAERIRDVLKEPFVMQGLPLAVEASIGGALVPAHAEDAETIVQRADVAMYLAKTANTDFELYDARHDEYDPTRLTLIGELRRALEREEIVLYFQPKAELRTGEVRRGRGARPLAAPRARASHPRRVHPARPAHGPDPAADALRARGGAPAMPSVAAATASIFVSPSTWPCATSSI